MGNALLRGEIQEVGVIFNGDQDDSDLRKKIDRLEGAVIKAKRALREAQAAGEDKAIARAQSRLEKASAKLKKEQPEKDNVVTAVLSYPRSGESSVVAMRPLDIPSGSRIDLRSSDFFESALLKEEIQGETVLQIKIADKDRKNRFWLFIRGVLSAVLGSVTKDAIGDISEVFVAKTAAGLSKKIEDAIKGNDKERVSIIAESKKARIEISDGGQVVVVNSGSSPESPVFYDSSSRELSLTLAAPKDLVVSQRRTSSGGVVQKLIKKGAPNGRVVIKFSSEVLA